jgi:putative transposase
MVRRKVPRISDALLDQLLSGADPETVFDPNGLLDDLRKAFAERVLNAEIDHHLAGDEAGNSHNGYGRKMVTTETGRFELEVPRDRQATFDPQLIAKYPRRFPGFDDKTVSIYARGMSTREIVGHQPGGAKASSQSAALLAWLAARTMARLSSRSTSAHDPM